MTHYANEDVLITTKAVFDGETLSEDDVSSVTVTIYDTDGEDALEETAMSWVAEKQRWQHLWTGGPAGVYQVKTTFTLNDGSEWWEYRRLTIKPDPV